MSVDGSKPSRIFERFDDEASFLRQLSQSLDPTGYVLAEGEGQFELRLKGHHRLPHRAPRPRRLSLKRRPNTHEYEPTVTLLMSWLIRTFKPRMVFDIGAGDGYFSAVAASVIDVAPTVHAFEMLPGRAQKIVQRARVASFGANIVAHNAGMSDTHRGDVTIWHSVTKMFEAPPEPKFYRYPWWSRLKFRLRGSPERDSLVTDVVSVTSVDHFCEENRLAPDIIKMDVDGYEAKAVPGAMGTLRRHRPFLLLELHKSRFLRPFGVDRPDVVAPLFAMGYRALLLEDHNSVEKNVVRPVDITSSVLRRQQTDFFLFY